MTHRQRSPEVASRIRDTQYTVYWKLISGLFTGTRSNVTPMHRNSMPDLRLPVPSLQPPSVSAH